MSEDVISIDVMDLLEITKYQRNDAQDGLGIANATIKALKKENKELREKINQLQQQVTSEVLNDGHDESTDSTK